VIGPSAFEPDCRAEDQLVDNEEVARLSDLLEACHRVLPNLVDREDELAEAIRRTCEAIESRLRELAVEARASSA
jgi:hypothetical protein